MKLLCKPVWSSSWTPVGLQIVIAWDRSIINDFVGRNWTTVSFKKTDMHGDIDNSTIIWVFELYTSTSTWPASSPQISSPTSTSRITLICHISDMDVADVLHRPMVSPSLCGHERWERCPFGEAVFSRLAQECSSDQQVHMVQFSSEESTGAVQSGGQPLFFDRGPWTAHTCYQQHQGTTCYFAASQCCCIYAGSEGYLWRLATCPIRYKREQSRGGLILKQL